jgi:hypothetical protein
MTAATVTVSDLTRVYNGTTTIAGVAHNWDMTIDAGKISGAPVYTAIGKDVGEHAISLTGLYSNQEGYDIIAQDGTVNITAKAITVSGVTASDKVYNADATAAINTGSAVITAGAQPTMIISTIPGIMSRLMSREQRAHLLTRMSERIRLLLSRALPSPAPIRATIWYPMHQTPPRKSRQRP